MPQLCLLDVFGQRGVHISVGLDQSSVGFEPRPMFPVYSVHNKICTSGLMKRSNEATESSFKQTKHGACEHTLRDRTIYIPVQESLSH